MILQANDVKTGARVGYWTGKAGPEWVAPVKSQAFDVYYAEAFRKADLFNSRAALHGLTFYPVHPCDA